MSVDVLIDPPSLVRPRGAAALSKRSARPGHAAVPARLPIIAVVVLAALTAAGNSKFTLVGMGIIAALVLVNNSAFAPIMDPVELSLTVLLAVVVAVPFGILPHSRSTSTVFVVGLLTIGLSGLLASRPPDAARGRLLVMTLFGLLAIAAALSPDAGAIKRLLTIAAGALPAFFLGTRLDRERLRTIAWVVVALGLAESVLAVLEPFAFPSHLWLSAKQAGIGTPAVLSNPFYSSFERSQGTLGHPLVLGVVLVIALGLVLRVLEDLPMRLRLFLGAVLVVGLGFTGDRSCLIGAFLIIIAGRRVTVGRVLAWVGSGVAALLILVEANAVSGSSLSNFAASGSYLHRVSSYNLVWRLFHTQSFWSSFGGNGFGSTQRLFDAGLLQGDGFKVVDNQFVLTQAQGGILCLGLLIAISIAAILRAGRQLRAVVVFVVAVSVIFDWLSWPSDSALSFMLLGAALAVRTPIASATRPQISGDSALSLSSQGVE